MSCETGRAAHCLEKPNCSDDGTPSCPCASSGAFSSGAVKTVEDDNKIVPAPVVPGP